LIKGTPSRNQRLSRCLAALAEAGEVYRRGFLKGFTLR